ncbi:hypothetical protein ACEXOS_015180 [Herbiconiux sp. P16]|uniref:hypothetical protein n=1 Tax=Herbiconiux wuyangfengii TaxID=3342794 RepID=UPI0035BB36D1
MSEENEIWAELEANTVLELLPWAADTTFKRVAQDYDKPAGHKQTVVGVLAYTYLQDLLDRATSCGEYALPANINSTKGVDLLREGITQEAFEAMPRIDPALISRSDYNGSPGWATGSTRWLLQSFPFGGIDKIQWSQKSLSKQIVADQPYISPDETLVGWDELGVEEGVAATIDEFVGTTLVLAHGFERESGAFEMYLGRSRTRAHRGESPWHWKRLVIRGGGYVPEIKIPAEPLLPGNPPVRDEADADVRLRRPDLGESTGSAED